MCPLKAPTRPRRGLFFVGIERLERGVQSVYDGYVTYIVQYGGIEPHEQPVESVGAAARIAVAFVRERRRDVCVRLPDGTSMDFEAFQEAVFRGDLQD